MTSRAEGSDRHGKRSRGLEGHIGLLALVFTVSAVASWADFGKHGGGFWLVGGCVSTVAATAWLIRWRRNVRRDRAAINGSG